jgi:hypothetical protein
MDLDNLKAKWQQDTGRHAEQNKTTMEELHRLLHGKTFDFITATRKKYEKIISIMLMTMMVSVLMQPIISDGFTFPGSVSGFVKLVFFFLVLIFFYWMKLLAISNIQLSDHIKERLTQLIALTEKNKRIEVIFVLCFVATMLPVGWFFYGKGMANFSDLGFQISAPFGLFFLGAFLYAIVRRHNRQLTDLQSLLKEYNEGTES